MKNIPYSLLICIFALLFGRSTSNRCDDENVDANICGAHGKCGASGLCQCFNRYKGMLCEIQIKDVIIQQDGITDGQMTGYAIAFILFFVFVFFLIIFTLICLPKIIQRCKQKKKDNQIKDINKVLKSKIPFGKNQNRPEESLIQMNIVAQKKDNNDLRLNQNQPQKLPSIYLKQPQTRAIYQGFKQRQNQYSNSRSSNNQLFANKQEQYLQQEEHSENLIEQNQAPVVIKEYQKQQRQPLDSQDRQMSLELSFIRSMKTKKNDGSGYIISQQNQKGYNFQRTIPKQAFSQEDEAKVKDPQINFNPPLQSFQDTSPENLNTQVLHNENQLDQDQQHQIPESLHSMGSGRLGMNNSDSFRSGSQQRGSSENKKLQNINLSLSLKENSETNVIEKDKKEAKFIDQLFQSKNLGVSEGGIPFSKTFQKSQTPQDDEEVDDLMKD